MDYLTFHVILILPPIVLMAATLPQSLNAFGGRRAQISLPLIAAIAFSYTTPWDNYLVAEAVWWYGPGRIIGTVGTVPLEEYLFFILQPLLTGLFCFHYLMRAASRRTGRPAHAWGGFLLFGILTISGIVLLAFGPDAGFYLALILSWAPPLLAGMWLYDGETLWAYRWTLCYAVGVPTLYLWAADAVAIHAGIWTISKRFTLGPAPFGLPIEEATFFLMTNLLVVKGILLLLYGTHDALPSATRIR